MRTARALVFAAACAGMVSHPLPAGAQALSVGPVNVQLMPDQTAAALTVENQSGESTAFQVRAFEWREQDGHDALTRSDALVASPPLGTLPAHGKQVVRLVLRRKPAAVESTYRIWIDQIPSAAAPDAVRIALRFSIPVFAEPDTRVAPDVHWQIVRDGSQLYLVGENTGSKHETIRELVLKDAQGNVVETDRNDSPHILAGGKRSWHIVSAKPLQGPLHLIAQTDGPQVDEDVALPPPAP